MPIKRPDIYEHNNPNDAFVDSDFVRGGIRTTANTINDLYTLSGKTDQLKVYATKVYVVNEDGYYILKDINNVDNINGWIREDVLILSNINDFSATTISATTYLGLPKDVFVTGGTYNAGTATFTNNTGGTFNVVGFSTGGGEFTGGTVTGPTIFTNGLSANTFSASTYLGLPLDIRVTGGTYSNLTGIATFVNNSGDTFSVSGFSTGYTLTNSEIISVLGYTPLSSYTDTFVTGGTYNAGTVLFTNNTGGTFTVTGFSDSQTFTGGTVTGPTVFTNGLSANTFSATTYLGLPKDVFVTGGTYNAGTATFVNNTGGTFNVVGFSTGGGEFSGGTVTGPTIFINGLSANTFSATTYLGLPLDIRVTGGTYSNGVTTFTNNTGGTFSLSGFSTGYTLTSSGITNALGYTPLSAYTDTFVTGGTYDSGTNSTTFTNNSGGTFNVSGPDLSLYVPYSGAIDNVILDKQQFIVNTVDDAIAFQVNSLADTTPRVDIGIGAGGDGFINLYDKDNNLVTTIEDGNITTNRFIVNGGTSDQILLADGTLGNFPTEIFITGGTYSAGTAVFTNTTGGTFSVSGFSTGGGTFTGGTVTGPTIFTNGLSANTISATTYQNLPLDIRVTGGTYNAGTATFTNNTGGTFNVTGFSTGGGEFTGGTVTGPTIFTNGLSANTISATTYQNLPLDIRITGGTYSSGTTTLTLTNNTGGTVNVTGFTSGGGGGGITPSQATGAFGITIDGLGGVISSGQKGYVYVPYDGTITGWSIFSDVVGSCVVDVWKDTYGTFPPTVGDSIAGTQKPTLSGQRANRDLTLSSWTTTLTSGDVIGFNVEASPTGVTRVNLIINVIKS